MSFRRASSPPAEDSTPSPSWGLLAPSGGRPGTLSDTLSDAPPPSVQSTLGSLARGLCAASLCTCFLLASLLCLLPLPFIFAWLASPPSFDSSFPLVFDYREREPSAMALLMPAKARRLWLQNITQVDWALRQGQRFEVKLHLRLPETEHNVAVGMFQVSCLAVGPTGEVLSSSSVPFMVRYSSFPKRIVRAAVLALPMMLGLVSEVQEVSIPLLKDKVGPTPVAAVKVVLHSAAGAPSRVGLPQILSARLRISTRLWGSSPWLLVWPLSAFVWLMGLLCCCQATGACICCGACLLPTLRTFLSSLTSLLEIPETDGCASGAPSREGPVGALPPAPRFLSRDHEPPATASLGPLRGVPVASPVSRASASPSLCSTSARASLLGSDASATPGMPAGRVDEARGASEQLHGDLGQAGLATGAPWESRDEDTEDEEVDQVLHVAQETLRQPSGIGIRPGAPSSPVSAPSSASASTSASVYGSASAHGSTSASTSVLRSDKSGEGSSSAGPQSADSGDESHSEKSTHGEPPAEVLSSVPALAGQVRGSQGRWPDGVRLRKGSLGGKDGPDSEQEDSEES